MKLSPFLPALAALALVPVALAGGLPKNTAVRVEISGIDGWHEEGAD